MLHLVSIALDRNPQTRAAWQRAQAAAAQYGRTRSQWYPDLGVEAGFYYDRQLNPSNGFAWAIEATRFVPSLAMDYVLLDFGRREADDDRSRQRLWAANLEFNRQVQQTIYDVQAAYFRHDEAIGLYDAAVHNLELASAVVESVEDRLGLGLAEPQARNGPPTISPRGPRPRPLRIDPSGRRKRPSQTIQLWVGPCPPSGSLTLPQRSAVVRSRGWSPRQSPPGP